LPAVDAKKPERSRPVEASYSSACGQNEMRARHDVKVAAVRTEARAAGARFHAHLHDHLEAVQVLHGDGIGAFPRLIIVHESVHGRAPGATEPAQVGRERCDGLALPSLLLLGRHIVGRRDVSCDGLCDVMEHRHLHLQRPTRHTVTPPGVAT